ncbi:hypothetical protein ACHQM5_010897 [Ranunculus cassubicifolius]
MSNQLALIIKEIWARKKNSNPTFTAIASATRGIEREIASLQLEEKKLVAEIKKTAKTGNEAATKILAPQLVRLRQHITNLQGSRAQIRGVATHTQAMYASTAISTGMKGATKAMTTMNKLDMLSESIDETLDKDEAEEETEELTNKFWHDVGIDKIDKYTSCKTRDHSRSAPHGLDMGFNPLVKRLSFLDSFEFLP